jgi:ribosome maturation factor RimP
MENFIEKVKEIAEPILKNDGLELVDIEYKNEGGRRILRIYIDKENGVNIGDCEKISERLGFHLDVLSPVDRRYYLEVSSPGLDRPLRTRTDFTRAKGKKVKIDLISAVNSVESFSGVVESSDEQGVYVFFADGGKSHIPFNNIKKAAIELNI